MERHYITDWETLSRNDLTQVETQVRYWTDGKTPPMLYMDYRYVQEIPDDFFDTNRHLGQAQKHHLAGNTQDHRRLVARVPAAVMNEWAEQDFQDGIEDFEERMERFEKRLADPDNAAFRVGRYR